MARDLRIVGELDDRIVGSLASVTALATLEEVLRWGGAQRPPCDVLEVLVQDEYTHDVVVRGPAPAFLVFDTT